MREPAMSVEHSQFVAGAARRELQQVEARNPKFEIGPV
jgi:hypothetical protein